MIRAKLEHHTVAGHLGSRGMGDVYQATDSKLRRSVAIKILPEAFAFFSPYDDGAALPVERVYFLHHGYDSFAGLS